LADIRWGGRHRRGFRPPHLADRSDLQV
jgi:hypothetical protein